MKKCGNYIEGDMGILVELSGFQQEADAKNKALRRPVATT